MRKLFTILLIGISILSEAQIFSRVTAGGKVHVTGTGDPQSTITFDTVAFSAADKINKPFAGVEQWHGGNDVNVPTEGVNTARLDVYHRSFYQWSKFETADGVFDYSEFDSDFNSAIDNNQRIGIGPFITVFPGPPDNPTTYSGAYSCYPQYLNTLMQGESVKSFKTNGTSVVTSNDVNNNMWVPNVNSEFFLTRYGRALRMLANHINTTSHNGVLYKDVLSYVDVRGNGAYGEWHWGNVINDINNMPAGTIPTVASLKRIIDSTVAAFPNTRIAIMIAALEAGVTSFPIIRMDSAVGRYALQASNNVGVFSLRRDSFGDTSTYITNIMYNNSTVVNGYHFDTAIANRYKRAPIMGEPVFGVQMTWLPREVRAMHVNSMGNSNYGVTQNSASKDSIRLASKLMGSRIHILSGTASTTITRDQQFSVTLTWANIGLCPVYEDWDIIYELRNGSNVKVWSDTSSFQLKFFQPPYANKQTVTDYMTIPGSVSNGTYSLRLVIKDPKAYRSNFEIYNSTPSAQADKSYILKSITF